MKYSLPIAAALLALPLIGSLRAEHAATPADPWRVYIGTYTRAGSQGIYRAAFDAATGRLSPAELAAQAQDPSFVTVDPQGRFLYSVDHEGAERPATGQGGGVLAFAIDRASGNLTPLGPPAACGGGPCYVAVDRTGRCLLTANYANGVVAALPIRSDGSLGDAATRIAHADDRSEKKRAPHAHSIDADHDNRFAIAADLGLDELRIYRLDARSASLAPGEPSFVRVPPGSGPRHFVFHPNGKFAYANMEISSQALAFAWDGQAGKLTELQSLSTLPPNYAGQNSTAEIQVHPAGRFVYVSNRGHDSIAIFAIDAASGRLAARGQQSSGGKIPRHFAIDPTGRWLLAANQDSNNIVVFRIDQETGALTPAGPSIEVGAPVCVQFAPVAVADEN